MNIIVKILDGSLCGVYTDAPGEVTVRLMDEDRQRSDEAGYEAARLLVEKGAVRKVLSGTASQELDAAMPMPDPKAALLLREENRASSNEGRQAQTALLAYIDGYLTATAALDKEIMKLCSSCEEICKRDGMRLFALTDGLRGRLNRNYDVLVEYLNQPENFFNEPSESSARGPTTPLVKRKKA